jgi:NAD(P)-dependent dehydrogenase (short-subunit alcohol dehydrogenase family)
MRLLEAHTALSGKIAIVIGGAAGYIGAGVSLGLPGTVRVSYAYVTDPQTLDAFFDRVEGEIGRADILVNVAGGVRRSPFEQTNRTDHARDIRLNFGYAIDSCQRAIPLPRKSGNGGSSINFTTIEAHRGAATFAVYAGAKAAKTNFNRALAVASGDGFMPAPLGGTLERLFRG